MAGWPGGGGGGWGKARRGAAQGAQPGHDAAQACKRACSVTSSQSAARLASSSSSISASWRQGPVGRQRVEVGGGRVWMQNRRPLARQRCGASAAPHHTSRLHACPPTPDDGSSAGGAAARPAVGPRTHPLLLCRLHALHIKLLHLVGLLHLQAHMTMGKEGGPSPAQRTHAGVLPTQPPSCAAPLPCCSATHTPPPGCAAQAPAPTCACSCCLSREGASSSTKRTA